jgi:hypothetical protein
MSLKSFSIYIVKFFELYISAVLLPIDYSYFFCCFVEIKKIPLWSICDSALNIFSIFYTHHRIPNKHRMTINFDTITNNYEVIYVIKTVMKYHLKK